MTMFYLAICLDCTPVLPVPFTDKSERQTWIDAHVDATVHVVVLSQEERP